MEKSGMMGDKWWIKYEKWEFLRAINDEKKSNFCQDVTSNNNSVKYLIY